MPTSSPVGGVWADEAGGVELVEDEDEEACAEVFNLDALRVEAHIVAAVLASHIEPPSVGG